MIAELVHDLSALLEQPGTAAETAIARRLAALEPPPPLSELLELGARARLARATREELALAVGTWLALHAGPAGARAP